MIAGMNLLSDLLAFAWHFLSQLPFSALRSSSSRRAASARCRLSSLSRRIDSISASKRATRASSLSRRLMAACCSWNARFAAAAFAFANAIRAFSFSFFCLALSAAVLAVAAAAEGAHPRIRRVGWGCVDECGRPQQIPGGWKPPGENSWCFEALQHRRTRIWAISKLQIGIGARWLIKAMIAQ